MSQTQKLYLVKTNLLLENYGIVLTNAYCVLDSVNWSRTLGNFIAVTIKVYANEEAMLDNKEGFYILRNIPYNEQTVPPIQSTRQAIVEYLISSDSVFADASLVTE